MGFYKRAPIGGEFEQVAFADFADPATQAALLAGSDVQLPSGYAGVNPDMLIWTPEGGKVLVAIEGQPTFDEDAEEVAFDRRNPEVRRSAARLLPAMRTLTCRRYPAPHSA